MRTLLVLICSVALACSAGAAQNENKSKKQAQKKSQVQSSQHTAASSAGLKKATSKQTSKHYNAASRTTYTQKTKGRQQINNQVYRAGAQPKKSKGPQQIATQSAQSGRYTTSAAYSKKTKQWKGATASTATFQSGSKTYKAHRFNLASNTRPTKFAPVTFQPNRRIMESQNWQGQNYWAFRNYRPVWHERNWWNSHYNRVVFVFGGWYYWNAGWWYPAWGYAPNAYYAYDGPIYAYNNLPPDQVVANIQAALQGQGYYQGEIDGLLGPLTRAAIANYQRDHGLYMTSAIDRPTLKSLGMA
jgi:putative peptidoglycan binding protein